MTTKKIFGLGLSKTGTSSLQAALQQLDISCVHYPYDSRTFQQLRQGDYNLQILEQFQSIVDIPAAPYYAQFDQQFPGSRFILTIRNMDEWIASAEKHWELMMQWWHHYPEFQKFHEFMSAVVYGTIGFNADRFRFVYQTHIANVRQYFQHRGSDYLELNICGGDGWDKLCRFLNLPIPKAPFPHANEWMHKLMQATQEWKLIAPAHTVFILADQEGFGTHFSSGQKKLPMMQRNGIYHGEPANDEEAIKQFEELLHQNPAFFVLGWPCFWWADTYPKFYRMLSNYPCLLNNSRLKIFKLSN